MAIISVARDQGTTYRSIGDVQGEDTLPFLTELNAKVNLGYKDRAWPLFRLSGVQAEHGDLDAAIKSVAEAITALTPENPAMRGFRDWQSQLESRRSAG